MGGDGGGGSRSTLIDEFVAYQNNNYTSLLLPNLKISFLLICGLSNGARLIDRVLYRLFVFIDFPFLSISKSVHSSFSTGSYLYVKGKTTEA